MNMIDLINKANAVGKYLIIAVFMLNLASLSAANGAAGISAALSQLCSISQTFLGAAVMVLIVLAGAIYAIGQVLGAETRARAAVWATAMLTGALIGAIIYIVTPFLLKALFGTTAAGAQISTDDPCSFGG